MSSWEAQDGKRTFYIHVQGDQVVIGSHHGSGHTDNAGVYTAAQILAGEWDAHITRHFPGGTLAALKAALRGPTKPPHEPPRSTGEVEDWEDFD